MSNPMTFRSLLLVFALVNPVATLADMPPLLPTEVRGSDCIALEIATVALPKVRFFTDHCAGPKDPLFIGLDGTEYSLHRSRGAYNAFPFQGRFIGDGLVVVVIPIRLLEREPRSKQRDARDDYRPATFEVVVQIAKGGTTRSVKGVMSQ